MSLTSLQMRKAYPSSGQAGCVKHHIPLKSTYHLPNISTRWQKTPSTEGGWEMYSPHTEIFNMIHRQYAGTVQYVKLCIFREHNVCKGVDILGGTRRGCAYLEPQPCHHRWLHVRSKEVADLHQNAPCNEHEDTCMDK